ncbi:RYamide receptor-like [Glandiceps talaboti]
MPVNITLAWLMKHFDFIVDENGSYVVQPGKELLPSYGVYAVVAVFSITFMLIILRNGAVILVSTRANKISADLKVYLISLAIADIGMGVFCLPFLVSETILQEWVFGDVMCPLVKYAQKVSVIVSIYTLVVVSIDRLRAVKNPLNIYNSTSTHRKSRVVVTISVGDCTCCQLMPILPS